MSVAQTRALALYKGLESPALPERRARGTRRTRRARRRTRTRRSRWSWPSSGWTRPSTTPGSSPPGSAPNARKSCRRLPLLKVSRRQSTAVRQRRTLPMRLLHPGSSGRRPAASLAPRRWPTSVVPPARLLARTAPAARHLRLRTFHPAPLSAPTHRPPLRPRHPLGPALSARNSCLWQQLRKA